MKLKSFVLLLFFFNCCSAQHTSWLVGSVKNCLNGTFDSEERKLKIFEGNQSVDFTDEGSGSFYAKNIEPKTYIIQYENIFGQTVKKEVKLDEGNNFIDICVNDFVDNHVKTFISSVNPSNPLKITFREVSGPNEELSEIVLFYKRNHLWADYSNGKKRYSKKIKAEVVKELIIMEKKALEAQKIKDDTSAYRNIYTFELGNKKIEIVNRYMQDWHFQSDFFITIFGEKKYLKN